MKRFLCLLVLAVSVLSPRLARAQYPLGTVAAVFPFTPSKLLADPVRTRVYAAVPTTNSVVVIDTTTLQVIATLPIGSDPVDMAISMDGNTLYVANNGSTLAAVGVVDLNALTTRASFPLPGSPVAIAAGLGGRVYASVTSDDFGYTIEQFDGTTGTIQGTFNQNDYDNNLFQISPDGTTLFEASTNIEAGTLKSFDVSTATPPAAPLQTNSNASDNDSQIVISHNGKYLCLPSGGGNPGAGNYSTFLFSTADITSHYGSFANGAYPGPLAFSPDDSLVYQTRSGTDFVLDVYSTTTFLSSAEITLPTIGSEGYPDSILSIVVDNTGSYLFVSESSSDGETSTGQLAILTTGVGTLTPTSVLPAITSSLSVNGSQGVPFTYQIAASGTPTSYAATGLPATLTLNTATGLISGTPTDEDFYDVQISASNASGTATATLELEIDYNDASYLPVFTTTSLPNAVVGQVYSYTVAATNSPYAYSASGLPVGLSIDATTGVISGTPTGAAISSVFLDAENDDGDGTATLSLTVTPALPVITSGTVSTDQVGTPFAYQITASGAPTSYAATDLPAGLSVNAVTGLISGTPTVAGTYPVTLGATNAGGTSTRTLGLTVTVLPAPVVASSGSTTATVGQLFSYQIVAGNNPTSYAATGLPAGLSVDAATGLISGAPTQTGAFNVNLGATNASGTGNGVLALTVLPDLPTITLTATTPTATVGSGEVGEFTLSLSTPLASDLIVNLTIKGSAVNGTDYVLLKDTKKIKAGHTSKPIRITPLGANLGGVSQKTVVLTLSQGDGYFVGTTGRIKVKLLAPVP